MNNNSRCSSCERELYCPSARDKSIPCPKPSSVAANDMPADYKNGVERMYNRISRSGFKVEDGYVKPVHKETAWTGAFTPCMAVGFDDPDYSRTMTPAVMVNTDKGFRYVSLEGNSNRIADMGSVDDSSFAIVGSISDPSGIFIPITPFNIDEIYSRLADVENFINMLNRKVMSDSENRRKLTTSKPDEFDW